MSKSRISPVLVRSVSAVAVLLVCLGATQLWAARTITDQEVSSATDASQRADQFRDQLESESRSTYYMTHALDPFVRDQNGVVRPEEMQTFLLGAAEHGQFIRSVSVAPNNKIAYIAPTLGNKAALGLNLEDQPEQWPAIKAVIDGAPSTLVGPINLVQGGRGFAYRLPIVLANGRYWGLASTMIDADTYLNTTARTSNVSADSAQLRLANPDGSLGEVFWGSPTTLPGKQSVINVQPIGANWVLSVAIPPVATSVAYPTMIGGAIASVLLALLVFVAIWGWQRRTVVARRLDALSRHAPGMLFQFKTDDDGPPSILYVSDGARAMFGVTPEDAVNDLSVLQERVDPADATAALIAIDKAVETGEPWHQRIRIRDADGHLHWYVVDADSERADGGSWIWHGFLADSAAEVAAEDQLSLSASVFASTHDGVLIMDRHGDVVDINPAFSTLTGYQIGDLVGRPVLEMLGAGLTTGAVLADMQRGLARHGFWRGDFTHRTKSGQVTSSPFAVSAVKESSGDLSHYVAVFGSFNPLRDDIVTGLPSRRIFDDRLSQFVESASSQADTIALLVIGLDRFKDVNETMGHQVGDLVLRVVAERLRSQVAHPNVVARLGSDEFAVMFGPGAEIEKIDALVVAIFESLALPIEVADMTVHITASMGISVFPDDTSTAAGLLTNANQAMRIAKEDGRNRYYYFTARMQNEAHERAELTAALRDAIGNGELHVEFQPILSLKSGETHKAEALLRWNHPDRGSISPDVFIPIAEQAGLIKECGDFVLTHVIEIAGRVREIDPNFQISMNMSPTEISDENGLHGARMQRIAAAGLPGSALVLEITEGVMLDRSSSTRENIGLYREAGLEFAIDDFGTGYSSLSYLQELDVDFIKIDRSFVSGLPADSDSLSLCQAIIEMAHRLGLRVIAEGIETQGQRDVLVGVGCDYGQGFLFARSVSADGLLERLRAADR